MTELEFKAMKSVYSFCYPEVYTALQKFNSLPYEAYKVTGKWDPVQKYIENIFTGLDLPYKGSVDDLDNATINLDKLTEVVLEKVRAIYSPYIKGLDEYPYVYYTAGSAHAMLPLMLEYKTWGIRNINTFSGEYDGFRHHAHHAGLYHNDLNADQAKSVWWITNPQSQTGTYFPAGLLEEWQLDVSKVVFDLSYYGQCRPQDLNASHENIRALILSLSKPYGVFRYRLGGFTFSRDPIDGLVSSAWEADPLRLLQSLYLLEKIPLWSLYKKYNDTQTDIVSYLNETFDLCMEASDFLLTAFMHVGQARFLANRRLKMIEQFQRKDFYRFCLTPFFEEWMDK